MNINLTLFGQMITFAVFVWLCMKFIWPPIVNALAKRKERIAQGLAAAERGHQEKALGEQRALEVMNEAKDKAAEIVSLAQRRATDLIEEAKGDARTEGDRLVIAAQAEIDRQANRAREELREKVTTLAIAAAEKILQKEINVDTHKAIVDDFAKQL